MRTGAPADGQSQEGHGLLVSPVLLIGNARMQPRKYENTKKISILEMTNPLH
jgi:hypothetical protein